jgi:hypothetical protein
MNGGGQGEGGRLFIYGRQPILRWHCILGRQTKTPQAAQLALLVHEVRILVALASRCPLSTAPRIVINQAIDGHPGSEHLARALDKCIPVKALVANATCTIGWLSGGDCDE